MTYRGWALLHNGHVICDMGEHASEATIWRVGLGWPSKSEIQHSINRGSEAFPCVMVRASEFESIEALRDHLDRANTAIDKLTVRANTLRDQLTLAEQRAEAKT
jgi:hypothetical protein